MPRKSINKNRSWMTRRSEESVIKRRATSNTLYDTFYVSGFPMFQPKPGNEYCIRLCPPSWENPKPNHWGIDVYVHNNIGADRGSFLCYSAMEKYINKTWGISLVEFVALFDITLPDNVVCPIDKDRALAQEDGDTDRAKALNVSRRVLVWLIDRDDEKVGPKLWATPSVQVDQEILALLGKPGSIIYPDDAEEGFDITFRCVKQGDYYNYKSLAIERDSTPMLEDATAFQSALDFLEQNPLPKMLNFVDSDYIDKVHSGASPSKQKKEEEVEPEPIDIDSLTIDSIGDMDLDSLISVAEELGFRRTQVLRASKQQLSEDIIDELNLGKEDKIADSKEDALADDEIPFEQDEKEEETEEATAANSRAAAYREKFNRKRS